MEKFKLLIRSCARHVSGIYWMNKNMYRLCLIMLFLTSSLLSTSAQSSVTFIINKKWGESKNTILLNGEKATTIVGEVVQIYKPYANLKDTLRICSPCSRTINVNKEGKNLFTLNVVHTSPVNGKTTEYESEIQLNLSPQSKHYILVTSKGLADIQLKELSEKEALKMLTNKKMVILPTVNL